MRWRGWRKLAGRWSGWVDIAIAMCNTRIVKSIRYTSAALRDLQRHRNRAKVIVAKIASYSEAGLGDVKRLKGVGGQRLRVGDFRVIFEETDTEIIVTKVGPRGSI